MLEYLTEIEDNNKTAVLSIFNDMPQSVESGDISNTQLHSWINNHYKETILAALGMGMLIGGGFAYLYKKYISNRANYQEILDISKV